MSASPKGILLKIWVLVMVTLLGPGIAAAATKTLTIKGSNSDSGDTIQIPDTAQVNVQVADQGITITMPDLNLRLRCLGEVTDDGYCYVAAGGSGGGTGVLNDFDGDRVPDDWDQLCPNTPSTAPYTDSRGCADIDSDGYFTPEDACPTQGTQPVDSTGCPIDNVATTYTVTATAGAGGSISPSGAQAVAAGGTVSFTLTASPGYSFSTISGNCPSGPLSGANYTTGAITQNCTVEAIFTANNTSGYCSGTPEGVICDPNSNGRTSPGGTMDSWSEITWGFENTPIPNGKVVAYPFLANAGAGNGEGIMEFSNNMPDLTASGYTWKGWFSETPGGAVMNNNNSYCRKNSANPNPQQMRWSQSSDPNRFACNLGQAERVLYFNMAIGCYEEVLATVPLDQRDCTVGEPFQGVGGFSDYYIRVYPIP